MKFIFTLFFFLTLYILPAQNLGIFLNHSNNFATRNSTSIGLFAEIKVGKKTSPFYLNFQHNIGINDNSRLYAHTSLPVMGILKYFEATQHLSHKDDGYVLLYSFLMPVGVTYYFKQKRDKQWGVYCNALGYDYWQLKTDKEINAATIELGVKGLYYLNKKYAIYTSLGSTYQINIGSKKLLPDNYKNSAFFNFSIGFVRHANN